MIDTLSSARVLGLALDDFLDALPIRREALITKAKDLLAGKRILELGPHTGYMTEEILQYSSELTLIESDPACLNFLIQRFGTSVCLIPGDIHFELPVLKGKSFDIVICAGVLYHSASPFHILESLALLRPKYLLIDTLTEEDSPVRLETSYPNRKSPGHFRPVNASTGFVLHLSASVLQLSLERLGYDILRTIEKESLAISSDKNSRYFRNWKNGFSCWFVRRDEEASF